MTTTATEYAYITYETLDEGTIARIMLNRPQSRNAQNRGLLVELGEAFLRAEADDNGARRHPRRGGTDLLVGARPRDPKRRWPSASPAGPAPDLINGATRKGAESADAPGVALLLREHDAVAQPSQDHHRPGARDGLRRRAHADVGLRPDRGGRRRQFADVVGTRLGMCGVEYFAHPWEFGPRRTKELMSHRRFARCGRGPPAGHGVQDLPGWTISASGRSSSRGASRALPTMTALLIKESVNQTVDNMGFYNAIDGVLQPPPAQSRPLGRDSRRRAGRGAARRWCPVVARRATGGARRQVGRAQRRPRSAPLLLVAAMASWTRRGRDVHVGSRGLRGVPPEVEKVIEEAMSS